MSRFSRWVLGDSSILFVVPFMFLLFILIPIEFSSAQEDETTIEICSPASTLIIATDGGLVDISALDESEVARVTGAKGSAESVVAELKEACGFTSFVLVDGNGNGSQGPAEASAVSVRASDKYIDPLSAALIEACNYSVAIVEVQKEDVCAGVSVPACTGDKKASPWLEVDEDNREYLWYRLGASPWLEKDDRGFVWSDLRASPWLEANASPWLEANASPWISNRELCIDDQGYLWSNLNGYFWSNLNGYLWSNLNGYLWSNLNGYLWSNGRGYFWSN